MIVQSTRISRNGGYRYLETHLLDKLNDNERIEILAGDRGVLADAQALADARKCRYAIRHLSISPEGAMSPGQLTGFVRAIDTEFGIGDDRPRLVVLHQKAGRVHFHLAVAEIDPATGRVLDNRHDFSRLERLARGYEAANGEQIQMSRRERASEKTEGLSSMARQRAERIAESFDRTRLKQACMAGEKHFRDELRRQGLAVVTGEKGLILIDSAGRFVAAAHRAAGMKKNDFKQRWEKINHGRNRTLGDGVAPRNSSDVAADGTFSSSEIPTERGGPDRHTPLHDTDRSGAADRSAPQPVRTRWAYLSALAYCRAQRALLRKCLQKVDWDDLQRRAEEMAAGITSLLLGPRDRLRAEIGRARVLPKPNLEKSVAPVLRPGTMK